MKKGISISILCASQSSTSTLGGEGVVDGGGGGSLSSSSVHHRDRGRGPAIDRYNPIIHDQSRLPFVLNNPENENENVDEEEKKKTKQGKKEEKSNVEEDDAKGRRSWRTKGRKSWSCINPGGFISPSPGVSSRFLLTGVDTNLQPHSPLSSASLPFQVVVLRVSLHCRGCEKKLRKHISTMQGVSSYNIEFAAKKVTVEGNVTPLGVLASISKVKNAQLWFPVVDVVSDAPAPAPPQTISDINNTPSTIIAASSSSSSSSSS